MPCWEVKPAMWRFHPNLKVLCKKPQSMQDVYEERITRSSPQPSQLQPVGRAKGWPKSSVIAGSVGQPEVEFDGSAAQRCGLLLVSALGYPHLYVASSAG